MIGAPLMDALLEARSGFLRFPLLLPAFPVPGQKHLAPLFRSVRRRHRDPSAHNTTNIATHTNKYCFHPSTSLSLFAMVCALQPISSAIFEFGQPALCSARIFPTSSVLFSGAFVSMGAFALCFAPPAALWPPGGPAARL